MVDPAFLQSVNVSILPRSDNTYDLGSPSYRWRNGYFAGSIKALPVYQGYESITKDLAFAVGARFENVLARRNIVSVEYYDETTGQWVQWDVDVTPLFDDDISWGWLTVDYTHRKFRITVHAGSYGQYSHFLFVWGASSGVNGHTITIETSSDLKTWVNEGTLSGGDCYYTQEIFAKFDSGAVYTSTRPYLRFTFDIDMNENGYARLVEILGFMFRVVHSGSGHKPFIALYDKSVRFRNTIFPEVDNAYDLGKSTNRWRNVYFAGTLTGGVGNLSSLQIGGTEVIDSSRNLKNVTASRSIISDFFATPFWDNIPDKPFSSLGSEFKVSNGELQVNSIDFSKIANRTSSLLTFDSSIIPDADNTYDLGSSSLRWRSLYAVNVYTGDVVFQNGWRVTEYDENGRIMNGLRVLNKDGEEILRITESGIYFKGQKLN